MATQEFPSSRIHSVAAISCLFWVIINIAAHAVSKQLWKGYGGLSFKRKLTWCNRIASALHAAVLVCNQAKNLRDPLLLADPLFAVTDAHFFWGSVMYGYLAYDTLYMLVFYKEVGSPSFVFHHILGLVCCCFGLYFNKLALFGMAIQFYFEGTTPLLHLLGCMKIAGLDCTRLYMWTGVIFTAQFFVFRVVVANYYGYWMGTLVLALQPPPVWGVGGVAVYALLCALNFYWFVLLVRLALRTSSKVASTGGKNGETGFANAATKNESSTNGQERISAVQEKSLASSSPRIKSFSEPRDEGELTNCERSPLPVPQSPSGKYKVHRL